MRGEHRRRLLVDRRSLRILEPILWPRVYAGTRTTRCRGVGAAILLYRRDNSSALGGASTNRDGEFQAIGPAPFETIPLADMGADVLRVYRAVQSEDRRIRGENCMHITERYRSSVRLDPKQPKRLFIGGAP